MIWLFLSALSWAWPIKGKSATLPDEVETAHWFQPSEIGWAGNAVNIDPLDLAAAAGQTLKYLHTHPDDERGAHPGMLSELGVDLQDVKETLAIISFTGLYYPELLRSPSWWEYWFNHYSWRAGAVPRSSGRGNDLRLTRYVIYSVEGSTQKSDRFTQALWQVPNDELDMSEEQAMDCSGYLRCQLTRQEVLQGDLEGKHKGTTKPLIWVSEYHFQEAQLQGTIVVKDENGVEHWFNVHRSNQKPYVKGVPPDQQKRFWFFKKTDGAYGWGRGSEKIPLHPGISMAGDIDNLGLGKVIWIQQPAHSSIGILSDTGGAFQPNLQQLDWFMGIYANRESLNNRTSMLPSYAPVGIVIRKRQEQQK